MSRLQIKKAVNSFPKIFIDKANDFAASLLMPKDDVLVHFKKWSDLEEDDRLQKLAKRYEVSMQAMSVRLNTLGLISF